MKKKTQKQTSTKTSNTVRRSSTKKDTDVLVLLAAIGLILVAASFLTMGLVATILLVVGILAICGIAYLIKKSTSKSPKKRKVVNIILMIILCLGILGCVGFGGFMAYVVVKAPAFNPSELDTKEPTIIYDANNEVIAMLGSEMRDKISYDDMPQVLVDAIVATEDSRFFQHNGLDAPRFLKASLGQIAGKDAGGASTLSMQVIKNSFTSSEDSGFKGIVRKFTDIYLAMFKLEKNYSKEEILEFYVNNHLLGGNVYGVEQASVAYFGKSVKDLSLSEAAILAGMFKSPNYYRPDLYPERAEARRNTVLYLMEKHGYISEEEKELAASIPVESLIKGKGTTSSEYQDYIDTVVAEVEERYDVNPYVVPMLIYTNMDRSKQDGVNRVMNGTSYSWVDDVIQSGVAVVDSQSGKILAIGAGRNREGVNAYNYATQIKRQPGSTAKPLFDYGPGVEYEGWGTYTQFIDEPWSYTNGPSIQNWDGKFMGNMTLKTALSLSRNVPALQAFQKNNKKNIESFVKKLGITPENPLHEAHALGAFTGVSPLQMASAYAAFSNGGYYYEPFSVSKIVYRDTKEEKTYSSDKVQAMSDSTAYIISNVLQNVSISGSPIKNMAAKTGTTNYDDKTMEDYKLPYDAIRDSWLVGYTTNVVVGMWYGYDLIDSEYCMHNIPSSNQRDKLFRTFINEMKIDTSNSFKMPSSVVQVAIEKGSGEGTMYSNGLLASDSTPSDMITYEYYRSGTEPTETSKTYSKINTPTGFKASYSQSSNTVSLSWNKVSTPSNAQDSDGAFGYNVYYNDVLLGFTEKTTYQITNPKNVYGTYKVVATFKNNSKNQSSPATYELKESSGGSDGEVKYSSKFKLNARVTVSIDPGKKYAIKSGADAVTVYENNKDVTNSASISYKIVDGSGRSVNEIDLSATGVFTITYTVSYKTYAETYSQVVTVN